MAARVETLSALPDRAECASQYQSFVVLSGVSRRRLCCASARNALFPAIRQDHYCCQSNQPIVHHARLKTSKGIVGAGRLSEWFYPFTLGDVRTAALYPERPLDGSNDPGGLGKDRRENQDCHV